MKSELNKLFRKALLSFGDYLVYSSNWSFISNGTDRDKSWKRFLKETGNRKDDYWMKKAKILKELLDAISIDDVKGSLVQIIKKSTAIDWRRDFIENTILWERMGQYHVKFIENGDSPNIYVLRNSKFNRELDPEIKSLIIKQKLIDRGVDENQIKLSHIEEYNQYGISQIKNVNLKIVYNHNLQGKYLLKEPNKEEVLFDSQEELMKIIMDLHAI